VFSALLLAFVYAHSNQVVVIWDSNTALRLDGLQV